jgi:hypothetical protein
VRAKSGPHDNVQQHSGDWTMTGKVPVARAGSQELPATIGRMDAILNARAMAGSPDADFADVADSVSPSCDGFCISGVASFREPMKENHDV